MANEPMNYEYGINIWTSLTADGGWFCSDETSKFEGKIRLLLLNV